jgi:hypothetical protein
MGKPVTLAAAWHQEASDRGASPATPGYDDARNLFYAGAAAMLAMVVDAGTDGGKPSLDRLVNFLHTTKAELREYLEEFE